MGNLASVKAVVQHPLRMGLTIEKRQQKDFVAMNQVFLTQRLSLNGFTKQTINSLAFKQ